MPDPALSAAIIVAFGAFIGSCCAGAAAIIVALRTTSAAKVVVEKLDKAADGQKDIHLAVNSNFSRLQNQLYAAVAVVVGLIAYIIWNLTRIVAKEQRRV